MIVNNELLNALLEVRDMINNKQLNFYWFDSARCAVGSIVQVICSISDVELSLLLSKNSSFEYSITWTDLTEEYFKGGLSLELRDVFLKMLNIGFDIADFSKIEKMNMHGNQLKDDISTHGYVEYLNDLIQQLQIKLALTSELV